MSDLLEPLEFAPEDYFQRVTRDDLFPGDDAPVELDLGSGDGGFVLEMARVYPERRFLAVERLLGRVRKTCRRAHRQGLHNVRVLRLDIRYSVAWLLPHGAFARIHVLFPDPWPKKKHQKRRLMTPGFVRELDRLLARGGEFVFKTDHADYFEEALQAVASTGLWEPRRDPGDGFYAETDFERQWKEEGKSICEARWSKRPG